MTFERRRLGEGGHVLISTALEEHGFLAAFTERTGGESAGPYATANLSFSVGDEDEAVSRNRDVVAQDLDSGAFATAEQVHGAKAVRVGEKRAGAGFHDADSRIPGADAMYTGASGIALAVLAADCVPIVMTSGAEGLVAVVHAGWRGIASGLIANVMSLFEDASRLRAAIGPAIGPCHYEVGEDVALAVAAASDQGAVTERRDGRLFLDLPRTIGSMLRAAGMKRVEDSGLCTACLPKRFFSHRRDDVPTGRQAAVAMKL